MQITLDISNDLPLERIKQLISELESRLKTHIQVIENKNLVAEKTMPKFGSAKGLISMAADFDEPLEDFSDYMP